MSKKTLIQLALLCSLFSCYSRKQTVEECKQEYSINLMTTGNCQTSTNPGLCQQNKDFLLFLVAYEVGMGCEKDVSHAPFPFRIIENVSVF